LLAEWIQVYEALKDDKKALHAHQCMTEKDYKALFEFLKEADAFALQQAQRNLESALRQFLQLTQGSAQRRSSRIPSI
jgi:hypothetical protein